MNSADLPKSAWKDPAAVYEQAEEKTCQGCSAIVKLIVSGSVVVVCSKGQIVGNRCKRYVT